MQISVFPDKQCFVRKMSFDRLLFCTLQYESNGNTVMDDNLDQVEQALVQMKRVELEIGNQLHGNL